MPLLPPPRPVLLRSVPGTLHSPGRIHQQRSGTKPRLQLTSSTLQSLHVVRAQAATAQRFMVSEQ